MDLLLLLEQFWSDLTHFEILRQMAALFISVILAQCGYWIVQKKIRAYHVDTQNWQQIDHLWLQAGVFVFRVAFSTFAVMLSYGLFHLLRWQDTWLLASLWVMLSWLGVKAFFFLLRWIFKRAQWTVYIERILIVVFSIGVLLHFAKLLEPFLNWLDSISIQIGKHHVTLIEVLMSGIWLLGFVLLGFWVGAAIEAKLMKQAAKEAKKDSSMTGVRLVLARISRAGMLILFTLLGMSLAGIDLTLFSVFGGALGVGLGFGLQKIASNYISGFVLLLDKSLSIGSFISVNNYEGYVKQINTRFTVIDCFGGREALVPNEILVSSTVENFSFSDNNIRIDVPLQISYDSDLKQAISILKHLAQNTPRILKTPEHQVLVKEFAADGINLSLCVWINDPENGRGNLKSELLISIWQAFKDNNISVPFPQREVRIINPQTISL
jgi:small-conductance mechanosensitive channel